MPNMTAVGQCVRSSGQSWPDGFNNDAGSVLGFVSTLWVGFDRWGKLDTLTLAELAAEVGVADLFPAVGAVLAGVWLGTIIHCMLVNGFSPGDLMSSGVDPNYVA